MIISIFGVVWLSLTFVMYSQEIEQKILEENIENFSYSLYLNKIGQKTIQLTVVSIVLPFTIHSIFSLRQSVALTSHVVSTERDLTAFVKNFFIETFPNVSDSLLFETLLQASPQEILEKLFELFYNQNQDFEKNKVKELFTTCCQIQQEGGDLLPKLNVPPIPAFFSPQLTFLEAFKKNLLNRYQEKIEKIELIHKILHTFAFIKPYLKEIHSNPFKRLLSFFKKTPISIAISPQNFLFSDIIVEKYVRQFP